MAPLPDEIEAYGLVLRRWRPSDAQAMHDAVVANTDHLRPWMAWIALEPMSVDDRRALVLQWEQAWSEGGDVLLAVWRDGVVVGSTGLHQRIGEGGLEIGYWVDVDHLRRGIATATARAATDLAFTVPGIDRVEIHHDVENLASRGVPAGLGFRDVGEQDSPREERAPAETGRDRMWRMTREDWLSR
jgi:ribosomal-protein-serine acetyltransferase